MTIVCWTPTSCGPRQTRVCHRQPSSCTYGRRRGGTKGALLRNGVVMAAERCGRRRLPRPRRNGRCGLRTLCSSGSPRPSKRSSARRRRRMVPAAGAAEPVSEPAALRRGHLEVQHRPGTSRTPRRPSWPLSGRSSPPLGAARVGRRQRHAQPPGSRRQRQRLAELDCLPSWSGPRAAAHGERTTEVVEPGPNSVGKPPSARTPLNPHRMSATATADRARSGPAATAPAPA